MTKQLRVIVQVRNNALQQRREELGMNQAALCRAVGLQPSLYSAFESMKKSPIGEKGEWLLPALKLAEFHGVPIDELFPQEVLQMKGGVRQTSLDVVEFARLAAAGPEELLLLREQIGNVRPLLSKVVTKTEAKVLVERFGLDDEEEREHKLAHIADHLKLSRARVGQIKETALAKLRKAGEEGDVPNYIVASTKRALHFGYGVSGHSLRSHDRRMMDLQRDAPGFPWTIDFIDGGLLRNRQVPDKPDGRVYWTCGGSPLWIAFFWWDRSGDTRGASNSGFYVQGFSHLQAQEAFDYACEKWFPIVERQKFPLVLTHLPSQAQP